MEEMKVNKVKRFVSKVGFRVKKYSPEILVATGVIGLVATAVLAYKARPRVEEVVDYIEDVKDANDAVILDKVYVVKELGRALALPIATGILSVGAITWSYRIQRNRLLTLTSVLAGVQASNKAFQSRVKEKVGEEAYNELLTTEQVESIDGEEVVYSKEKIKSDLEDSMGAWYSESEYYFKDGHTYNCTFIDSVVRQAEMKLFSKGYLQLNELREQLGLPRTRSGALLGWSVGSYFNVEKIPYNEENPVTGQFQTEIYIKWTDPEYIPPFDTW